MEMQGKELDWIELDWAGFDRTTLELIELD